MKPYLYFLILLCGVLRVSAQTPILSVGSTTALTITTGTVFSADSLVLIPATDFTMSSNTIAVSLSSVNLVPLPSINRVYYLGSPITFTGLLQLYYNPSELNGNAESTLEYSDSVFAVAWVGQTTSTVNTSQHFVQYAASARTFIAATASGPINTLPLSLISFSGNWDREKPVLNWVVDQTDETVKFSIESCPDGTSWNTIGGKDGETGNGRFSYNFTDIAPAADKMYYRIRLTGLSGLPTYSYVVKLQKGGNNNSVHLFAASNGVIIRFSGALPAAVRLVNVAGVVLRSDRTTRAEYALTGLMPGTYFLQYQINGQWSVRQFVVY